MSKWIGLNTYYECQDSLAWLRTKMSAAAASNLSELIADCFLSRFYTLLVLSTALFNKPPFKNLIVNGLVLATDGQKMSKKKKNYPDPQLVPIFLILSPTLVLFSIVTWMSIRKKWFDLDHIRSFSAVRFDPDPDLASYHLIVLSSFPLFRMKCEYFQSNFGTFCNNGGSKSSSLEFVFRISSGVIDLKFWLRANQLVIQLSVWWMETTISIQPVNTSINLNSSISGLTLVSTSEWLRSVWFIDWFGSGGE